MEPRERIQLLEDAEFMVREWGAQCTYEYDSITRDIKNAKSSDIEPLRQRRETLRNRHSWAGTVAGGLRELRELAASRTIDLSQHQVVLVLDSSRIELHAAPTAA